MKLKESDVMLNFTVGPVQSNDIVRSIGAEQVPYFRTPEFSNLMFENERLIKKFVNASDGSRVVFITGSGTSSMESCVMHILNDNDKALYYYDASVKDADGNAVTSYDIRIVYEDEDLTDCYFRKLPLTVITQITLKMDGTGDDAIPYATYLTGSSKKETSTLSEVKARLGLDDSEDDSGDQEETDVTPTPEENPDPTQAPSDNGDDPEPTQAPSNNGGDTDPSDASADKAKQYIGQPLSSLIAAIGDANGSDYENEPETGETGYHYYDTFTVSTTVDESGNEVVAGVW